MWQQFVCITYHLHYSSYLSHVAAPPYVVKTILHNGWPPGRGTTVLYFIFCHIIGFLLSSVDEEFLVFNNNVYLYGAQPNFYLFIVSIFFF